MKFSSEEFAKLIALALNEPPETADVLYYIEGDGLSRAEVAADLYYQKSVPRIVVTGEVAKYPQTGKSRVEYALKKLKERNVPDTIIMTERSSTNTREQAQEMVKLAKENGWRSMLLVVALYHQPRAYATFVKALREAKLNLRLINHPVRGLPWFEMTPNGTRHALLCREIKKINQYAEKGHVALFKEVLLYEKWKERSRNVNTNKQKTS